MTNTELKETIINYLKDKGNWRESDIEIINQIFYNKYLIGQAKIQIRRHGIIQTTIKGELRKNPAVAIWKQASNDISNIFNALSITPSIRRKLKLDQEVKDDDEFAKEFD